MALLEVIANRKIRRKHVFRDHTKLMALDDVSIIICFKVPRSIILELYAELRGKKPNSNPPHAGVPRN